MGNLIYMFLNKFYISHFKLVFFFLNSSTKGEGVLDLNSLSVYLSHTSSVSIPNYLESLVGIEGVQSFWTGTGQQFCLWLSFPGVRCWEHHGSPTDREHPGPCRSLWCRLGHELPQRSRWWLGLWGHPCHGWDKTDVFTEKQGQIWDWVQVNTDEEYDGVVLLM